MVEKVFFTKDEMVSFGQYLLSDARFNRVIRGNAETGADPDQALKEVYDADFANWQDAQPTEKMPFAGYSVPHFTEQTITGLPCDEHGNPLTLNFA